MWFKFKQPVIKSVQTGGAVLEKFGSEEISYVSNINIVLEGFSLFYNKHVFSFKLRRTFKTRIRIY